MGPVYVFFKVFSSRWNETATEMGLCGNLFVCFCLFVCFLLVRRIEESSPTQSSVFHFIVVASQFNFMRPLLFMFLQDYVFKASRNTGIDYNFFPLILPFIYSKETKEMQKKRHAIVNAPCTTFSFTISARLGFSESRVMSNVAK